MTDPRVHLRALAEATAPGGSLLVPREWVLALLESPAPALSHPALVRDDAPYDPTGDRLLTVEETAARLGVTTDWIYHHRKELPFAVKLGRKTLRFSEMRLVRYLETRRRAAS